MFRYRPGLRLALVALAANLSSTAARGEQGYTDVRLQAGGPRILRIAGSDVTSEPGAKRVLVVDGDTVRSAADGKCLLYVDGDVVRAEPGGLRLAYFDGPNFRRAPGAALLIYFDGRDVRPAPGAESLLYFDGDVPTRSQRAALLFQWRPELFRLSDVERQAAEIEQRQSIAAAREAERLRYVGTFQIRGSNLQQLQTGSLVVSGNGEYCSAVFDFGNNQRWSGVALRQTVGDASEMWIAAAPTGNVVLGIYTGGDGHATGVLVPTTAVQRGQAVCGRERLVGGGEFKGQFEIASAAATMNAAPYTGKLTFTPFKADVADADLRPVMLSWSVVGRTLGGIGLAVDDGTGRPRMVAASSSVEKYFLVGRLKRSAEHAVHVEFCVNNRACGNLLLTKTSP